MAIDGGLRGKLATGTKLVARYKGEERVCEVVAGEGDKVLYRLADGREFKSPSAAGSAVVDGACNGWRFWSLEGTLPEAKTPKAAKTPTPKAPVKKAATKKPAAKKVVTKKAAPKGGTKPQAGRKPAAPRPSAE